jgi:phosphoglycolate phosphatase
LGLELSAPVAAKVLPASQGVDWSAIDLVVFDVDGTLYDQRRLRTSMLWKLLGATARSGSLDLLRTLRVFRRVREQLGDGPEADFTTLQYTLTASQCGKSSADVQALVQEWMEQRPLPLLAACRYPHLERLFDGLRAAGKKVSVLSDYPAVDKVKALGLQADPVVSAVDPGVRRLKPDPAGLHAILVKTGVAAKRALMIGDRFDRDGAVARRANVHALIRSRTPHPEFATFTSYDDPVFAPMLATLK